MFMYEKSERWPYVSIILVMYAIVRYLYNLCVRIHIMKQSQTIMQDMYVKRQRIVYSLARPAECYVCGKGPAAGCAIRAKTLDHGIVILCDLHYSD